MTEINITSIGGQCPVQAEGDVFGFPFYFRARHGAWTFDVASKGRDPVDYGDLFQAEGVDTTGGYLTTPEAMAILGVCLDGFRDKYFEQLYNEKPWPDNSLEYVK